MVNYSTLIYISSWQVAQTVHQATMSMHSKTVLPNHTFTHVQPRLPYAPAELPWKIPPTWLLWKTSPSLHCSLTNDVMTVVSAQVTVMHRVCSHQAANSLFLPFFPVTSFLGKFTESKFLPISSPTYGSEVWGFQISRLIGSLIVVFEAEL